MARSHAAALPRHRCAAAPPPASSVVALLGLVLVRQRLRQPTARCRGGKAIKGANDGQSVASATPAATRTRSSLPAGPTNFEVTDEGVAKVTEFEVLKGGAHHRRAREHRAGPQRHVLAGPRAGQVRRVLPQRRQGTRSRSRSPARERPRARDSEAAELKAATDAYAVYVEEQTAELVKRTKAFVAAVKAGDVERGQAAVRAHACALRGASSRSPRASATSTRAIDARVNDVGPAPSGPASTASSRRSGSSNTTKGMSADRRQAAHRRDELDRARSQTIDLQPAQLANGAVELLDEVSKSKITGEEDRYSHTDLSDFEANVDGAREGLRAAAAGAGRARRRARRHDRRALRRRRIGARARTGAPTAATSSYTELTKPTDPRRCRRRSTRSPSRCRRSPRPWSSA